MNDVLSSIENPYEYAILRLYMRSRFNLFWLDIIAIPYYGE